MNFWKEKWNQTSDSLSSFCIWLLRFDISCCRMGNLCQNVYPACRFSTVTCKLWSWPHICPLACVLYNSGRSWLTRQSVGPCSATEYTGKWPAVNRYMALEQTKQECQLMKVFLYEDTVQNQAGFLHNCCQQSYETNSSNNWKTLVETTVKLYYLSQWWRQQCIHDVIAECV